MDISTIGTIIKKERESCGLTQAALAKASHISRVTIVNLENGNVGDIGAVKLSEIAENDRQDQYLDLPRFPAAHHLAYWHSR